MDGNSGDLMDDFLEEGHLIGDLVRIVIESLANSLGKKKEQPEESNDGLHSSLNPFTTASSPSRISISSSGKVGNHAPFFGIAFSA